MQARDGFYYANDTLFDNFALSLKDLRLLAPASEAAKAHHRSHIGVLEFHRLLFLLLLLLR